MHFGVVVLSAVVFVLSSASFVGLMKFRKLTKSVRVRSMELPKAAELAREVSELRSLVWRMARPDNDPYHVGSISRPELNQKIQEVELALNDYRVQLENCQALDPRIAEKTAEMEFVVKFKRRLGSIKRDIANADSTDWIFQRNQKILDPLETDLSELQRLSTEIPVFMQQRMETFSQRARTECHANSPQLFFFFCCGERWF